jgi:hypothetical protein
MAYNPTCVMLSSLKSLVFHSLNKASCFSGKAGAEDPGIQ